MVKLIWEMIVKKISYFTMSLSLDYAICLLSLRKRVNGMQNFLNLFDQRTLWGATHGEIIIPDIIVWKTLV